MEYAFVTEWSFAAPIDAVWDALVRAEQWPEWWPAVRRVEVVRPGAPDGVGAVRRFTWKGRLPYTLSFDMEVIRVVAPAELEGIARGELEGKGLWTLRAESRTTHVRYDWNVRATKRWMEWLAPLARPLFEWNHDSVMRDGERGLARMLQRSSRPPARPPSR